MTAHDIAYIVALVVVNGVAAWLGVKHGMRR